MAKQEFKTRQTQVDGKNGDRGQQLEHVFTVDDSCLPAASELQAYKDINPELISFLLDTSKKEQAHRHQMDELKIKTISYDSKKMHGINLMGMFYAFIIMIAGLALSAYLIYNNKDIIGTIFGGISILTAASMFINKDQTKKNK
jgi:uncharacterized membrane protein